MALKFSQITASLVNFTTGDVLLGVQSATADRTFSLPQLSSAILTSPTIGGHATIEGVTLTGATGTGKLVFDHAPTIGTATINNSTLGTATISNSSLGTATINNSTLNTATLNVATINTATINTSTLNSPVINTATINSPVINSPSIGTATISTATLSNVTINTATINNATLATATIGTSTINNSTLGTSTLNVATINTATINTGILNNVTVNPSAATTGFVLKSNGTVLPPSWAGGMVLLNTLTPNGVSSAADTTSFSATYRDYIIMFENVAPATQAQPFQMTMATSGSNFTTASYVSLAYVTVNAGSANANSTSALLLSGIVATGAVSSSTVYGYNGYLTLFNPSSSIANKSILAIGTYLASTNAALNTTTLAYVQVTGFYTQASPVTGVNFSFASGNIATGTIKIYGLS